MWSKFKAWASLSYSSQIFTVFADPLCDIHVLMFFVELLWLFTGHHFRYTLLKTVIVFIPCFDIPVSGRSFAWWLVATNMHLKVLRKYRLLWLFKDNFQCLECNLELWSSRTKPIKIECKKKKNTPHRRSHFLKPRDLFNNLINWVLPSPEVLIQVQHMLHHPLTKQKVIKGYPVIKNNFGQRV